MPFMPFKAKDAKPAAGKKSAKAPVAPGKKAAPGKMPPGLFGKTAKK